MDEASEIAYIFHLHNAEQFALSEALIRQTQLSTEEPGMKGEPLPYQLRSDWMVTSLLLVCFILVSHVLSRGKHHLQEEFKNYFLSKERASIFDDTTASDMRHTLFLIFQTCLLLGFSFFDYFFDHFRVVFNSVSHQVVLLSFILMIILFYGIKWIIYSFINSIFFDKIRNQIWIKAYFNVIIWIGFLLYPVILLVVFFHLSHLLSIKIVGVILILSKILLGYKCYKNFFNSLYGLFHFILYFCALEILPSMILWQGILFANSYWF